MAGRHPGFRVYMGSDGLAREALQRGASGLMSAIANVRPELVGRTARRGRRGRDRAGTGARAGAPRRSQRSEDASALKRLVADRVERLPGRGSGAGRLMRVLTVGETMALLDPLEDGATYRLRIGGAESNVAIALKRLGVDVTWISRLGEDPFGDLVAETLEAEGVDVRARARSNCARPASTSSPALLERPACTTTARARRRPGCHRRTFRTTPSKESTSCI